MLPKHVPYESSLHCYRSDTIFFRRKLGVDDAVNFRR